MSARNHPLLVFLSVTLLSSISHAQPAAPAKPKLVVAIIVDQFRYDYLTRFRSDYHGGLHRLLTAGADFTNAFYTQIPTVTAVGHSIFLSGAMPSMSGVVGNSWYERTTGKYVTSVCDWDEKTIGGHQEEQGPKCTDSDPASPRRLLASTLGDELREVDSEAKVIGVSIKARGAIMPSGHRAQGAYWFDDVSGHFVTSSFYMQQLPAWASSFNHQKLGDQYLAAKWDKFPQYDFHPARNSLRPYEKLAASPWGNELIEKFAEQAIVGEKLGQRGHTDLLTISFSSNDYVGHAVGPDAPEVRDMSLRTDELLANLFRLIDQQVGLDQVIVVLSADHGVSPTPEHQAQNKMPGAYVYADIEDVVRSALNQRFGTADWLIPGAGDTTLYLNYEAIQKHKDLTLREVTQAAKEAIYATPLLHVARVYTRDQLDNGEDGDLIAKASMNGYYPPRSGDLFLIFEPYALPGTSGTTHFSPWSYDRHVPLLFMGPGIKPGRYLGLVQLSDVAPTLATMLDLQTPSSSEGRVLTEMLH